MGDILFEFKSDLNPKPYAISLDLNTDTFHKCIVVTFAVCGVIPPS